ncbi:helix-turn-helix domain-containing protein [Mycoplasma parvum]|uniref:DnaA chromosomal replication initiation protein n=1 Tax=Mycoplasma parvum str. Indiana TaxID=1403316 RepID=U5NEY2_9MOLU|nr:helix-turn-helix domain-containing protein [Mycoplasma parvum]AGX88793.1 dnaA chromosomal replication initiation protein [Mycoplasma parvum str. Indiana]
MSKKKFFKKLEKELINELVKFKRFSENDFYIENLENKLIISKINRLLKEGSGKTYLILGEKGSGKTYLFKWLLKDLENFLYIDLENFQKNFLYLLNNSKLFISFLKKWNIILLDNFELLDSKSKFYKVIELLKKEREEEGKLNIFIESSDKNLFEYQNSFFDKNNIFYLNSPNSIFLIEIIKKLLQKYFNELKITESSISFLSLYLGKDLKIFINKLFKLFFFLQCFEYNVKILDIDNLKKILNELFNLKEKKELINYKNNSQIEIICKKKNFDLRKIKSKSKKREIVFERDQIIYILKEKLNFSIQDISKILFKSESGIIYSLKKIYKRRESNYFREYFDFLIQI